MDCSCAGVEFQVAGRDGSSACDSVLDICSDPKLELEGAAESCAAEVRSEGSVCRSERTCSRQAELGEGVTATSYTTRVVFCKAAANGGLDCKAAITGFGEVQLHLEAGDSSTCSRLLERFGGLGSLEFDDDISCSLSGLENYGIGCVARVDCRRSGKLGAERVTAHGTFGTECVQTGTGLYTCSCDTGGDRVTLEVESNAASQACATASKECPRIVDLEIGVPSGFR